MWVLVLAGAAVVLAAVVGYVLWANAAASRAARESSAALEQGLAQREERLTRVAIAEREERLTEAAIAEPTTSRWRKPRPSPEQVKRDKPWGRSREPTFANERARKAYMTKVRKTQAQVRARGKKAYSPFNQIPSGPIYVENADGCWVWQGKKTEAGYGVIFGTLAHRMMFSFYKAVIPPGMVLRHTCDNRACVFPDHLQPGTQKGNMRDMHDRVRAKLYGRRQKLTPAQRDEIAAAYRRGAPVKDLVAQFGVSDGYIRQLGGRRDRPSQ